MSVINPMSGQLTVEERAGAIRVLLERAGVYRAISARVALVTGVLSALLATGIFLHDETRIMSGRAIRPREFAVFWIGVFAVSFLVGLWLLVREAKRADRPFFSLEWRLLRNQIAPFFLIPLAFTGWFFTTGYLGAQELNLVVVWIAFYGLALLSTALVAPRSIAILGWALLLTSLAVPVVINLTEGYIPFDVPNALMGATFGLYHLIYAACNWRRRT